MAGFMVPEVWCDRCSLREQSEDEGTLRELRADLRLDGVGPTSNGRGADRPVLQVRR